MPTSNKHPVTGCRMDTIFGAWMIDRERLEAFRDLGWSILQGGELQQAQIKSQEIVTEKESQPYSVRDGIACMDISGPMTKLDTSMMSIMGGTSTMRVRKSLADARHRFSSGEIKGVFIEVDSPGGTVDGTSELAEAIRKTAAVMPVVIHASDCSASAALWVSTQATRFTCGPCAAVGSMGTIVQLTDASKVGEGASVKPVVISTGEFKTIGAPGHPITQAQMDEVKRYAESRNAVFKSQVQKARRMTDVQMKDAATARVYVGQQAVEIGLADAVCSADEAFAFAKALINNPKLDRRSPSMVGINPAAPVRSKPMPLVASQLANFGKLPGAAGITEDTAESVMYTVGMERQQRVGTLEVENGVLATENTRLKSEVAELKGKAPQMAIDPRVLRGMCSLAHESLKLKLDAGKITSAQFGHMTAALLSKGEFKDGVLSADAAPVMAMFEQDASGKYTYQKVFAALDEKSPVDIVKPNTAHQPEPRATPSEPTGNVEAKTFGLAACNQMREQHGMAAFTQTQFDLQYPESAGNK